jgi:CRP-like cAMP-binding protein
MALTTIKDLRALADSRLLEGDFLGALHLYAALVRLSPSGLDTRLRVGDALLALGEVQRAAEVYTVLARHAANGGYPLHALVAIKILEALEPQLGQLVSSVAALYGKGSPKLGRGVRLSLGDQSAPLPADLKLTATPPPREELVPIAAQIACTLDGIAAYPNVLPPVPLFSELPQDAFAALLAAMRLLRKRPGDAIVEQGDVGVSFYVLARGTVRVHRRDPAGRETELAKLHDGTVFGEMALVSAQPRSATVSAVTDCDVFEFDRDALLAASSGLGVLADALEKFTRDRIIQNLLGTSALFAPLDRQQRLDLVKRFAQSDVAAGGDIIQQGDAGQGLFVLASGEVEVWKDESGHKIPLATLHAGDVFGEISLVQDSPTTATVTALTNASVLFLHRDIFQKLMTVVPAIRDYVENLSDERTMDTRISLTSFELPAAKAPEENVDIDIDFDLAEDEEIILI